MPSLIRSLARPLGRRDPGELEACALCGRPVRDRDERLALGAGRIAHRACAVGRAPRRSAVIACRSALHVRG